MISVALLNELDWMDPGKDATSIPRFAEKTRTIFFYLAQIGRLLMLI